MMSGSVLSLEAVYYARLAAKVLMVLDVSMKRFHYGAEYVGWTATKKE